MHERLQVVLYYVFFIQFEVREMPLTFLFRSQKGPTKARAFGPNDMGYQLCARILIYGMNGRKNIFIRIPLKNKIYFYKLSYYLGQRLSIQGLNAQLCVQPRSLQIPHKELLKHIVILRGGVLMTFSTAHNPSY